MTAAFSSSHMHQREAWAFWAPNPTTTALGKARVCPGRWNRVISVHKKSETRIKG